MINLDILSEQELVEAIKVFDLLSNYCRHLLEVKRAIDRYDTDSYKKNFAYLKEIYTKLPDWARWRF